MTWINLSWYHEFFKKVAWSHDVKSIQVEIEIHDKCFTKSSDLLTESISLHKNMIIIYCSWNCNFWPIYSEKKHVKICFLINKRISSHHWNMKFIVKNLIMLIIQQENFRFNITNIYFSSFKSYNHVNNSFSIHCF